MTVGNNYYVLIKYINKCALHVVCAKVVKIIIILMCSILLFYCTVYYCFNVQYAARLWEYILAVESYNNDGGVAKISDQQLKKLSPPQK